MKRAKNKLILNAMVLLFCLGFSIKTFAQQKLIYYWNFDNFVGLAAAGSPSLILPIHANWSSLDSTKALISYIPAFTVSSKYSTYWDGTHYETSDTLNVRMGAKKGASSTFLRVRNPSDSMELLFTMPTLHYKNIALKFDLEKSSLTSGQGKQVFDYSTDGGVTWKTSGLSIPGDSITDTLFNNLVSVGFAGDTSVNNNANFIFRIKFKTQNTGTKGNNRFDNITLEGDTIIPAVSIANFISTYSQNFDSLSNSTASSALPYGWYLYETGTNANNTYAADSGSLTAGNTYSYGHKGNTNRALGSLASGSLLPNYGVAIRNNTGKILTSLTLGFTVEQWRLGSGTRGNPDSMYAKISTDATSLNSGTWTSAPSLTFTSPVYTGTAGQLDGNNAANQKVVNATLTGLSVPAGGLLWLKWTDPNIVSSDDGLAMDNFTIKANNAFVPKPLYTIAEVTPFNATTGVADSLSNTTLAKGYLKGVVMSPSFSSTYLQFSLADATGAITIFNSSIKYYSPKVGDSIIVHGYLNQYHGVMEYDVDTIAILTTGTWLETPTVLTAMSETYLSQLVELKNVHVVSGWATTGTSLTVTVSDGTNSYQLYITAATGIIGTAAPVGNFNVFGIESIYGSAPFTTGYELEPRFIADIQLISSFVPKPLYTIGQVTPFNSTTGVADSLSNTTLAKGYLKGVVMSPSFSTSYLQFSLVDATGAITIFTSAIKYYTPKVGDSILVHGYLNQYHGVMEYDVDTIATLTTGTWLETPTVLTAMSEPYLSQLIELKNVHVVSGWATTGTSMTVNVSDGTNTYQLYITSATGIIGTAQPAGNFNVFGIESIYGSAPFTTGYQLEPRFIADIQLISSFVAKPLYTIAQVRPQNATTGVADSLNKAKGYIKGVVMSPSYSSSYLQFSLVDNTGAITIFTSTVKYYTPNVGDSIMAHGYVTQFNGVTEYTTDSIIVLTKGTVLETPSVLTVLDEAHESHLIKINRVHLVDPTKWLPAGTGFNVNITNGPDTFSMRITSAIDLFKKGPIKGLFNVTGIETQFKSSSPYIGGYQIEPRGVFDIQPFLPKLYKIAQVTPYNATTGIADSIGLVCLLKGVVQSPSLTGSPVVEGFAVQDNTGGISVEAPAKLDGYNPNVGDSVFMAGTILQSNGLTVFAIDTIAKLNGGAAISPVVVTTLDETTESKLVALKTYALTTPSQWDTTKAINGLITVQANQFGTSNTITMVIAKGTNLYKNSAAPTGGHFDVTGIGSQNDPASPFLADYILIPRSLSDFVHSSGIEKTGAGDMSISVYPNPAADFVNINASGKMSRITLVDMLGNVVATIIPEANNVKINTNSFNKGVYIIKVESGENSLISRFVKE